jgi:hypothetical protein
VKGIQSSLAVAGFVAVLTGLGVGVASAHHSFGFYDMNKAAQIQGEVSQFEWANPHCWLFVTVSAPAGAPTIYGFEMRSVGEMLRAGWKKNSIKVGDRITVSFRPMRDGSHAGLLTSAKDASGAPIGRPPPLGPPQGGPPPGGPPPGGPPPG